MVVIRLCVGSQGKLLGIGYLLSNYQWMIKKPLTEQQMKKSPRQTICEINCNDLWN